MTTWTFWSVCYATGLFILAGIAEIGGGWLVWQNVRGSKPWWWSVFGALALVIYGFIPTFQHLDDFGRLYAVYGGFFIGLAFVWSYYFDGFMPDRGDVIGSSVTLIGVCIILFWPREKDDEGTDSVSDGSSSSVEDYDSTLL